MSVDPKEQNAELAKLIGANKQRLAHTQKMLRDLQRRTVNEGSRNPVRRSDRDKGG
ncbi:MAG TPA: hypothetical protein VF773_18555 [Verrucomicrobiae bacterium]